MTYRGDPSDPQRDTSEGDSMKAVVLTGIHRFDVKDVPEPRIVHDTDVLIRIKTVGVCGSDIHYYTTGRIGALIVEYPFTIGHETAGIVERTGSKVTRVQPGQRIAVDPSVSCGTCDQCRAGREHTCRRLLFLGCPKQLEGCLSEFLVLPEENCFPISDSMSFMQATLSEPLAIGVYAVEQSGLHGGATVGILGAGPIGMSVFHVARTRNAGKVFITDKIEDRLTSAAVLRPVWTGNPDRVDVVAEITRMEPLLLDVVFECCGDPDALQQGVHLLKPGGKLIIVGIPEVDEISLPIHELRRKEITIFNIRRQVHCTQKALDLLASGIINMDAMVTHHFTLDQTQAAFDLVAGHRDGVIKAMISLA
jgi:L-iditol 2-dehydrogenase